eukprot:GHVQ01014004.1.p1 GENE.GHVQ01014004.1~~GHVQ01014004.1.p1  ORF type:complete len:346 (+),score=33.32 GHVQ01014004.1:1642-2679(+)
MSYFIETMGCQMNKADSERIAGQLESLGFKSTPDVSVADMLVVNTCAIRDKPHQKVFQLLGRLPLRHNVCLVVSGCVAQEEGDKMLRKIPDVDVVMGPQLINKLPQLLRMAAGGMQVVATDPSHINEDVCPAVRQSDVCGWVNVIFGCNERCTYCVVPNTRGVEQARPKEAIRAEMEELARKGYKEVTLLGQNIDSWGRAMNPKQSFSDLLKFVADVPGLERIRFLTSHPRYMSERVVTAVAEHKTLCKYFHVPFQSGDNRILQNMNRGYTRERYLDMIKRIRSHIPDAAISADCIVGFPGETEEDFKRSLAVIEDVRFDSVFAFAYSPRPRTPAANWTLEQVGS